MKKILLIAIGFFGFLFTYNLAADIEIFHSNVDRGTCCGWVEDSYFKRPYTHYMVDEWTKPEWKDIQGGKRLSQDGLINGKPVFWKTLETIHYE